MRCVLLSMVSLLWLSPIGTWAQKDSGQQDGSQDAVQPAGHAVTVRASFPDAEIFGVKLVNGKPTEALFSVANNEAEAVKLKFVGGALWSLGTEAKASQIVRNLTRTKYNVDIGAGEQKSLAFKFSTELQPQDLRLELAAVMRKKASMDGVDFAVTGFNETVTAVEPDTNFFDPRIIFLYIVMLGCAGGVLYFFYTIWIAPYFPQQKRRHASGSDRPKKSAASTSSFYSGKKADPASAVGSGPSDGLDASASSTGAKPYNEEWIPSHHIQRPEARRLKSGPKAKSKGRTE